MDRRTINRAGFRRRVDGGTEYYVFPGVFRTDVCRGLNTSEVVKTLVNRGLLRTGSDGKPQKVVRLPGESDSQRMYVLRPEITRAAGDEGEEENTEEMQPQQDPAVTRYSL
jgi:putative DNA primase/helicase